jgi:carboxypeptidase C (cathepsin A)
MLMSRRGVAGLGLALAAVPHLARASPLMPYTAKAAMMQIAQREGPPDAEIFHVSYVAKGADPAKRPVTFVFNGGPGAASIYLHIAAIGPRVLATAGDGSFPSAPARLTDNPDSWLAFTDLVFIDPVGTGYSRMLPSADGKPGDPKPYFSVGGDVTAFAVFIRKWLTQNNRWASPKAMVGESYGGRRAAALTRQLAERYNVNLNRVVLLSPEFRMQLADGHYGLVAPMTLLPSQAAIASYHGLSSMKNLSGLKEVEAYAMRDYVSGLASLGEATDAQREAFFAQVGALIGIEPAVVARHNGRVSETVFCATLLSKRGQVIDSYDGSQVSGNPTPESEELGVFDRTVSVLGGIMLPPFLDYVRGTLGYVTDLPYNVLNLEANMGWDRSEPIGGADDLAIALAQNHDLKLMVNNGVFDMGANYMMPRYLLGELTRDRSARERTAFHTYAGGHMFYLRSGSRKELADNVQRFYGMAPSKG